MKIVRRASTLNAANKLHTGMSPYGLVELHLELGAK